ncbi:MAG: alpha/beta fold hydrolase [Caldilineaceae bacterium]|nr:alpha/beta fold hydrolase [Caldilineaceae bacterium]
MTNKTASIQLVGWLILAAVVGLVLVMSAPAHTVAQGVPPFTGIYKSWMLASDSPGIDGTLYLNRDGSAFLSDDPLNGQAPTVRSGTWVPVEAGVSITFTNDATGVLPQPILVRLDALDGALATAPGDLTFGERGRTFYSFAALAGATAAVPYNVDAATAAYGATGLGGVYKAMLPAAAGGPRDITLQLLPDFRVVLESDYLNGSAPVVEYGAWQDVSRQVLMTLTEANGKPYTTPVMITLAPDGAVLVALASEGGNAALVGERFYRMEGLVNALPPVIGPVTTEVPVITPEVTPEAAGAPPSAVVAAPVTGPAIYDPIYRPAVCPEEITALVSTDGVECGYLTVPENRRRAGGPEVQIFTVSVQSTAALTAPEETTAPATDEAATAVTDTVTIPPIVAVAGAPGESGRGWLAWYAASSLRETHSVIVIDPRGSGLSLPSLDCPELAAVRATGEADVQALVNCYNRLVQEGRDLAGYRTAEQAADIIDLARALDLAQIDLYGGEYGAAVARQVAERAPGLVRTLVLDRPWPLAGVTPLEQAMAPYSALRKIFRDCAADKACGAAYPDLEEQFLAVIDFYNATPAPANIGYGTGSAIAEFIFDLLARDGGEAVPALVSALAGSDYGTACRLASPPGGCRLPAASAAAPVTTTAAITETGATPAVSTWRTFFSDLNNPTPDEAALLDQLQGELGLATREDLFAYLDTLAPAQFMPLVAAPGATVTTVNLSEGVYFSLLCAEAAPLYTAEDVQRVAERLPAQVASSLTAAAAELGVVCEVWQVPRAAISNRIVQLGFMPAMAVVGTHDPLTPVFWARRAAADLDGAYLRPLAGAGHTLTDPYAACVEELLAAFLSHPERAPNPACYRRLRPTFVTPE